MNITCIVPQSNVEARPAIIFVARETSNGEIVAQTLHKLENAFVPEPASRL
jgi:hypothetical protein